MKKKRKGLMVTGSFPCIRVGKITEALQTYGWEHDVVCGGYPPQMPWAYSNIDSQNGITDIRMAEKIAESDAEIIHINNEPNWPVQVAKSVAGDRPVVLNVHDVTSARPRQQFDPYEESSFKYADGLIFVHENQRLLAGELGFDIDKPYAVIPNYTSSTFFINKTPLPHIGGLVYEGGVDTRNSIERWRDQSPIADVMEANGMELHIYSDRDAGYGNQHPVEMNFPILVHRLAQHDWGFCGIAEANRAWSSTIPNKFFDYMAAGIPVIVMNCEPLIPYCEMGLGIYATDINQIPKIVKNVDRKPYIKAIKEHRGRFTMLNHIEPVKELYEELT